MPALHDAIVARARRVLSADPRIPAAWLEGSVPAGTADRWSDVDLHAERYLMPEQRQRVRELVEAACSAGVDGPDREAVRRAHELVLGTVLGELRAACDQHGVPWPADHETQVRSFLCDEGARALSSRTCRPARRVTGGDRTPAGRCGRA